MVLPKGRTLKAKVREEKKLVKARLQAVKEWESRSSNFLYLTKKQLLEVFKRVNVMQLSAVLALTPITYSVLKASADFIATLEKVAPALFPIGGAPPFAFILLLWKQLFEKGFAPTPTFEPSELQLWMIAYAVSYIVVSNPEVITSMFGEGVGGVVALAKLVIA